MKFSGVIERFARYLDFDWAERRIRQQKVRSEGCFAAHLLSFPCAGFGWMVRRNGLELSERVNGCANALMV